MSSTLALGLLANAYGIGPYDFDYRLRSVPKGTQIHRIF